VDGTSSKCGLINDSVFQPCKPPPQIVHRVFNRTRTHREFAYCEWRPALRMMIGARIVAKPRCLRPTQQLRAVRGYRIGGAADTADAALSTTAYVDRRATRRLRLRYAHSQSACRGRFFE
jgi:hypothetical protein